MRIGSAIFLLCAGAGLGWVASALVGDRDEYSRAASDPVVPADVAASEVVDTETPVPDAYPRSDPAGELTAAAGAPFTISSNRPSTIVETAASTPDEGRSAEPSGQSGESFDAPPLLASSTLSSDSNVGGLLDASPPNAALSAVELAETILSDTQIVCEFRSWKGGPLVIDLIDYFGPGTARMTGALSAPEREFVVRMVPTAAGLHFFGLTSNGNFLAVTIFGVLDELGRYVAVRSSHQGSITVNSRTSGYWGTQWYGGCW